MRREGQKPKSCGSSPRTLEAAGHLKFGLLLTPATSRNFSPAPAGLFRALGRTENCRLVGLQRSWITFPACAGNRFCGSVSVWAAFPPPFSAAHMADLAPLRRGFLSCLKRSGGFRAPGFNEIRRLAIVARAAFRDGSGGACGVGNVGWIMG